MTKDKKQNQEQQLHPPQHQDRQPGLESEMRPRPQADDPKYRASLHLNGGEIVNA